MKDKAPSNLEQRSGTESGSDRELQLRAEEELGGGGAAVAERGGAEGEQKVEDILFSPEEGDSMFNTQINKQIKKVETFLKLDRLRKRK